MQHDEHSPPDIEDYAPDDDLHVRLTSIDVARLAGVSQSTVSRAFRNDSSMSPKTRAKVMEAARKLNYVPNSLARGLATQRSDIIAIVIGNLDNPFYSESLSLFSRELNKRSKHLLLFGARTAKETDDAVRSVLEYQVDGVIITAANASMRTAQLCLNRGIPAVTFNRHVPGAQMASVTCDNVEGGMMMTNLLIKAGARRFIVIHGETETMTNRDRMKGFYSALDMAGIAHENALLLKGDYSYDGAHQAILQAFADGARADAVLCLNDIMAMGAMDALKFRLNLRIPEDIMVTGFDDIPQAAYGPYNLTTWRQPRNRMVQQTLELLGLGEEQPDPANLVRVLQGSLVERGTAQKPF